MGRILTGLLILAAAVGSMAASAHASQSTSAPRYLDLQTADAVLRWINGYRANPAPEGVPEAAKALSRLGAFKDAEAAGVYIGFIAGVIGTEHEQADQLIARMIPAVAPEDHWVLVRAIAYSDHPEWRRLLAAHAPRMPTRRVMIDRYLRGQTPLLFQVSPGRSQTMMQRARNYYDTTYGGKKVRPEALDPSPELLDTFWGYYFATRRYRPVSRIVAMLPMSKDEESVEKLTLGNMAKFTLATNASRDAVLLGLLKQAAASERKTVSPILKEVIEAADTVEIAKIRKQALASIEELRRKGPGSTRMFSSLGQVGLGALSLGCVAAAATGQVYLGLPCVLGGAVSSTALRYWETNR